VALYAILAINVVASLLEPAKEFLLSFCLVPEKPKLKGLEPEKPKLKQNASDSIIDDDNNTSETKQQQSKQKKKKKKA
jgi:hypothetical protein